MATYSLKSCGPPARAWLETWSRVSPNIKCAAATPAEAPTNCTITYPGTSLQEMPPCQASARVTAGLKCAPEMGPKVKMRVASMAPVASVFARRARATLPPLKRSPMIPEPTTDEFRDGFEKTKPILISRKIGKLQKNRRFGICCERRGWENEANLRFGTCRGLAIELSLALA